MKILIIGNIGSGKTTLGKKIQDFTGFNFVQIDELRKKFLNNTVSGEYYCLYEFLKNIEENKNLILEFTGVGCHKYAIKKALEINDKDRIVILCSNRDFKTVLYRIEKKKFSYLSPFDVDLKDHANFIRDNLESDLKEKFWNCKEVQFYQLFMDNEQDLLSNIQNIKQILNF